MSIFQEGRGRKPIRFEIPDSIRPPYPASKYCVEDATLEPVFVVFQNGDTDWGHVAEINLEKFKEDLIGIEPGSLFLHGPSLNKEDQPIAAIFTLTAKDITDQVAMSFDPLPKKKKSRF